VLAKNGCNWFAVVGDGNIQRELLEGDADVVGVSSHRAQVFDRAEMVL
jgi:methylmalonyl-CoA mutase cobalamin-binding subunit